MATVAVSRRRGASSDGGSIHRHGSRISLPRPTALVLDWTGAPSKEVASGWLKGRGYRSLPPNRETVADPSAVTPVPRTTTMNVAAMICRSSQALN